MSRGRRKMNFRMRSPGHGLYLILGCRSKGAPAAVRDRLRRETDERYDLRVVHSCGADHAEADEEGEIHEAVESVMNPGGIATERGIDGRLVAVVVERVVAVSRSSL